MEDETFKALSAVDVFCFTLMPALYSNTDKIKVLCNETGTVNCITLFSLEYSYPDDVLKVMCEDINSDECFIEELMDTSDYRIKKGMIVPMCDNGHADINLLFKS